MISKKELAVRVCELESDIEFIYEQLGDLEKRVKKLESPAKKTVKKGKNVKISKQSETLACSERAIWLLLRD